ncbi:J domain-containing protein [Bordetella sp. LUAb4]|uniref:J domain-containing protein n=1 Tax=Bordetella sp. LUAb4 TaxID=2843195 RepID=UPI001E51714B|nr:J domain-containing protein [Bordetella sp. LUAb4]
MNHYQTLGVSRDAIPEVIKAAYKAMSQKHHPDRNGGDAHAHGRMQEINAAYAVLGSPAERANYDRMLDAEASFAPPFPKADQGSGTPGAGEEDSDQDGFDFEPPMQPTNAVELDTLEKLPYLRPTEYASLAIFGLFTAFIVLRPSAEKPAAPVPPVAAVAAIPVPDAPPRKTRGSNATRPVESAVRSPPASVVSVAPNGAPWPQASGYVSGYESSDYGGSQIELSNLKGSTAFFVKLINTRRGAKDPSRYVYLAGNQHFTIVNVAPGNYFIGYRDLATGAHFRTGTFALNQRPAPTDPTQLEYTTARFEFSRVGNRYLDSSNMSASEFDGS